MNEWENRLLNAAAQGKVIEVQKLLKMFVSPEVTDSETGRSALFLAAQGGHTAVMKMLLEAGAKSTPCDKFGITPLHVVAKDHNTNAVKILVLHGAVLDMKTSSGLTPHDFANYNTESWKVLEDAKKGFLPQYEEVSEVPQIPAFAIDNAFKTKSKKKAKKGGGKKGKKKKKK